MQRLVLLVCRLLLVVCLFLWLPSRLFAQNGTTFDQGVNPYSSLHGGDFDSVVLSNGNLLLHIPLISYPQRGKLHLGFFAAYDNRKIVALKTGTPTQEITTWAVQGYGVHPMSDLAWPSITPKSTYPASYWAVTPDATHLMQNTSDGYLSVDATGFLFNTNSNVMIDRDGIRTSANGALSGYAATTTIEDPNGNLMTVTYNSSNGTETLTDSLGRSIPFPTSASVGVPTTDFSGCSGPLPTSAATAWTVPSLNGGTAVFKFCSAVFPLSMGFCSGNTKTCQEPSQDTLPQSIVLPNLTTWTFAYDGFGNLSQVTRPTGGTVSYTWSFNSQCEAIATGLPLGGSESCPIQLTSRSVTDATGTHTWTYSGDTFRSNVFPAAITVTDPLGNQTVHTFGTFGPASPNPNPYEVQTQYSQKINGSQVLLKTVATNYSYTTTDFQQTLILTNVVPTSITTTWANGQTSQVQKSYDAGIGGFLLGQVTEERDYDYGSGGPGPLLRKVDTVYKAPGNPSYLANNLLTLPQSVTTYNGTGTQVALTTYGYDGASLQSSGVASQYHDANPPDGNIRGNQTSVTRWLNSPAGNLISSKTFFDTGEVYQSTDPKLNTTTFSPYMCTGTFPQVVTNAASQATTYNYDCNTGLVLSVTDPNNQTTSHSYDAEWRLTQTNFPDGGQTTYCYTDEGGSTCSKSGPPYAVVTTEKINGSQNRTTTDVFDGLGRATQHQLNSDPAGVDYTSATYDADGRIASVTNAYRTTNDPTYGVTNYTYDAVGRKTLVTEADGSTVSTSYTGNSTTVTDEAGKTRESFADGLGRMTEVIENPGGLNYITNYGYDALGDLTSVGQNGSRQRTFVYDSLKRLTSSTNPESGTLTYTYDSDGNVATRLDARGIKTTYAYDSLNRITEKDYSDGATPSVFFDYDASSTWGITQTNTIGRLTEEWAGMPGYATTGAEIFSYDPMGRIILNNQFTTAAPPYYSGPVNYTYDLAGDMTTYTNGEGVTFTQTFDNTARVTQITSSLVNSQHPGTLVNVNSYWPSGMEDLMKYGNNLYEIQFFNNRLQLCRTDVNTVSPTLAHCADDIGGGPIQDFYTNYNEGSADNGNVVQWNASSVTNFNRSYTYDQVNRSFTMTDTYSGAVCKGLSWTYDAWANRTAQNVTGGSCGQSQLTFNGNNQITTPGFTYDAAGNLTHDANHSYTYDAENRITAVDGGSTATYGYDAEGRRVLKTSGGITTSYLYDLEDHVMAEQQGSTWTVGYVYLNGALTAEYENSSTYFIHKDHLGSTRLITAMDQSTYDYMDYLPFGEQVAGTSGTSHKFTGKERDSESNLDNFGARYYSSSLGRFMSADWSPLPAPVPYANLTNPQTLNLYAIVRDNPESFADLDGHMAFFGEVWTGAATGEPSTTGNDQTSEWQAVQAQSQNQSQSQNQNKCSLWCKLFGHKVRFSGDKEDVKALKASWKGLMKSPYARKLVKTALKNGDVTIRSTNMPPHYDPDDRSINVNPADHPLVHTADGLEPAPTSVILGHELGHAAGFEDDGPGSMNNVNQNENPIRHDLGLPDRTAY